MMSTNLPSAIVPEPLEALNGHPLGPYRLQLTQCEPTARRSGWRRVAFSLVDGDAIEADWPVITGFYSVAGSKVGSWLDCDFYPLQSFDGRQSDLTEEGLATELFGLLGQAITSHCMVSYEVWENATDLHHFTDKSYRLGIPPAATPVGELLLAAGCVAGFKDWYIAEGGNEGPRKLQAEKPPTESDRAEAMETLARSLIDYLARRPVKGSEAVELDCRRRAIRMLEDLGGWPDSVRSLARSVASAAASTKDLLQEGPERVRKVLEERCPPWNMEDGP